MLLTFKDLNYGMEALKTFLVKTADARIELILMKKADKLQFIGLEHTFQAVRVINLDEDNCAEPDFTILLPLKAMLEITTLAKPLSNTSSTIELDVKEQLNIHITKYDKEDTVLSTASKLIPYKGLTDRHMTVLGNFKIERLLENDCTNEWETDNLLKTLSKMSANNAQQILFSKDTQSISTANSLFACYKNDSQITDSFVLNASTAKRISDIFKNAAGKLNILKDENHIIIKNSDTLIQLENVLAKKHLLSIINGFHSADYSDYGAVLYKNILLDIMKCFVSFTGENKARIKFYEDTMALEAINSNSRDNTLSIKVNRYLASKDHLGKAFDVSLDIMQQSLNICDTDEICLTIAMEEVKENNTVQQVEQQNAEQQNVEQHILLRVTSVADNPIRIYSLL